MKRDNKAITLIALVITIVVLIILAAVAINLSLGNNGIFKRAKNAKEQYANAQNYEESEIGNMSNKIDGYLSNSREYINVKSGTYTGTGDYGVNKKNTLTFEQAPQIIFISSTTLHDGTVSVGGMFIQGCEYSSLGEFGNLSSGYNLYRCKLEWSNEGKTVSWYATANSGTQFNCLNSIYKWVAIF